MQHIKIRGAREHNLKNINVDIPKGKLVVFTGISGSGKSSLAFDTIYAEGQRRYVESLSAYARQFLGLMEKPDVDKIDGLSPAISIDQKTVPKNPRSTVGTITEVYDYLRLLFARIGHPHCPSCGREIQTMTVQQIVDEILGQFSPYVQSNPTLKVGKTGGGIRLLILSPIVRDRKGEYSKLFEDLRRRGFTRVRVDNEVRSLDEDFVLIKTNRHTIEAVVDRVVLSFPSSPSLRRRLADSVETGLKLGNGSVIVSEVKDSSFEFPDSPKEMSDYLFSEHFACPDCSISLPALEPRSFSFNSPHGACPACSGLGAKMEIDPSRIINPKLSVNEGGLLPFSSIGERGEGWVYNTLRAIAEAYDFSLDEPIGNLPEEARKVLLYGSAGKIIPVSHLNKYGQRRIYDTAFEGVIPNLERRYKETQSDYVRNEIEKFMVERECEECKGTRLRPEALSVTIGEVNIADISKLSIDKVEEWIDELESDQAILLSSEQQLTSREQQIAKSILKELKNRLRFLLDVGLDYLTLNRTAATLSGGEAQRIRLASQIGSGLSGVLYVLDEPSVGLHARDQGRLLKTLKELRDLGNTVIVVEHDLQTMRAADYIFDFGPGAGDAGGEVVAEGAPAEIAKNKRSLTGQYLSGKRKVVVPPSAGGRSGKCGGAPSVSGGSGLVLDAKRQYLTILKAAEHNLKNIDVKFPLGKFICITGVSGSGKSTLLMDVLCKALALRLYNSRVVPGAHSGIEGIDNIDKVVNIDQSPIGRTPRSNPATYTGAFTPIRELFSQTAEARARGYLKGRFSFNVKGGRCESCQGDGQIKIEMQFLPDVYVTCEACQGARFNRETLEVDYKGKNIADILNMSVSEASNFFQSIPPIAKKLTTLQEVGLGYIKLGQPAPTLSGGEAQRVKLAAELSKIATGKTFYILDEPTTGLHSFDIEKLLTVLQRLVVSGNTVCVIEHNLDVIKTADWLIDLGPEGGDKGGRIIAEGPISAIMENNASYTGRYLKEFLK
ncbi:MAG: excinuclease ABC subunit UvrA [Candidatus Cloacimonetes bacterium]|nr:excinuclease ABC subunit UvrA [Candidatus Cloacimonadota bacterium]